MIFECFGAAFLSLLLKVAILSHKNIFFCKINPSIQKIFYKD